MLIEKSEWIGRFATRLMEVQPDTSIGLLPQIAETFWYYMRHRLPEEAADHRAAGSLRVRNRGRAWIEACSEALRELDSRMSNAATLALAEKLWDADWVRAVDPYVMAHALWDQAVLMTMGREGEDAQPIDPFAVFRSEGPEARG
ncbi:MAG: hypothetical protein ABI605_02995 [Rhizobacter sp.]